MGSSTLEGKAINILHVVRHYSRSLETAASVIVDAFGRITPEDRHTARAFAAKLSRDELTAKAAA